MPGTYYQPISRKQFLAASASLLGTAAIGRADRAIAPSTDSFRMALLSDTHLAADPTDTHNGFQPYKNLETVVPQVVATSPQAVVLNGDAARLTGEPEDYEALKKLLQPLIEKTPVTIGLGNHDHRKNFYGVFGDSYDSKKLVKSKHTLVLDLQPVQMLVLDSLFYVNESCGLLGKNQRTWLKHYLEHSDDRPTVLFIHHTLLDTDSSLLDSDRLFRIIKPYSKVKAIFHGHSHRYVIERREGVFMINLPAIGYNFKNSEPVGWLEAEFTRTGVAMKLHAIGGNREGHGETRSAIWG